MPSSLKSLVNEGTETGTTASASPTEHNGPNGHILPTDCEAERQAHTTEDHKGQSCEGDVSPSPPPVEVPAFDWEDFETRYMRALQDADEREREILREAENLSKYFRSWASAASAHDNDRAVKRLRTRQRFVNLSEEKMAQKQKHYEEVVCAFESALALLKTT